MNNSDSNTDKNFQYPKYTRKLFLADDENKEFIDQNHQPQQQQPDMIQGQQVESNNNSNSILPPNINQYQTPYPPYNQQSPYASNTASMQPTSYYNNINMPPQQAYQPFIQQPYMPNQYMPLVPPVNQMQPTPNYVQMMALLQQQQQQQQQISQNKQEYSTNSSLTLKKQGVSLEDYNESDDDDNTSKEKLSENNNNEDNKNFSKQSKLVPYGKNKRSERDISNNKRYKKPVISYEDNYMRPAFKNVQKVTKSVDVNKEIKANTFADKYKKMLEQKESKKDEINIKKEDEVKKNDEEQNAVSIEQKPKAEPIEVNTHVSESDSDSPPEEVKIEKKVEKEPVIKQNTIKKEEKNEKEKENVAEEKDHDIGVEEEEEDDDDEEKNENLDLQNKTPVPTFIPGTTISLTSDEDIQKWQQQRKINWLLKVSNKKKLHNEILANPENFKDSTDEEVKKFIQFQKENNLTVKMEEQQKNTFKEFGKIKETVKKMFQQIEKDDHQNNSTANIASMKIFKMEEQEDNLKVLPFIKLLGDLGKLEYKLTDVEKEKLFGYKK